MNLDSAILDFYEQVNEQIDVALLLAKEHGLLITYPEHLMIDNGDSVTIVPPTIEEHPSVPYGQLQDKHHWMGTL